MVRNKLIFIFLFIFLCFTCNIHAALEQQFTATDEANLNASIWNGEFNNIYDNPNDYAEDMSISEATITTFIGNFTGTDITSTGTITGDITSSTNAITPNNEPTSATGITYLPEWTAIDSTDSPYSVSIGDNLLIDTTGGSVLLHSPTPTKNGDSFVICDMHEWFGTNNLLIDPQGYYITVSSGTTSTTAITSSLSTTITYFDADGGEPGWVLVGGGYAD